MMKQTDGKVGMTVRFGRNRGEKTLAEIIKVNRKNFKVRCLEDRGTHRTYEKGSVWTVPPSLCEMVAAPAQATQPCVVPRPVPSAPTTETGVQASRAHRARRDAARTSAELLSGCDLADPPTYIKAARRYLDGNQVGKHGCETDSRQTKLYRAESLVTKGIEFKTINEAQKYLDRIFDAVWFKRRFSKVAKPTLEATWGQSSFHYTNSNRIRLSEANHFNERILIHEVIHAIVPKPHAGHGRLFCAIYLDMVRHFMGEDAYVALKAAFRKGNVKYTPYRTEKR